MGIYGYLPLGIQSLTSGVLKLRNDGDNLLVYSYQILAWRRTNYKHCDETIVIHFAHAWALFCGR